MYRAFCSSREAWRMRVPGFPFALVKAKDILRLSVRPVKS